MSNGVFLFIIGLMVIEVVEAVVIGCLRYARDNAEARAHANFVALQGRDERLRALENEYAEKVGALRWLLELHYPQGDPRVLCVFRGAWVNEEAYIVFVNAGGILASGSGASPQDALVAARRRYLRLEEKDAS